MTKYFTAEHAENAEKLKFIFLGYLVIFDMPKFTIYQTTPVLYHIMNISQGKNADIWQKTRISNH